jgi:hypothetical protein
MPSKDKMNGVFSPRQKLVQKLLLQIRLGAQIARPMEAEYVD